MDAEIVSLAAGPKGGLDVPLAAFRLFFALLDRGFVLRVEGDRLRVSDPNASKPDFSGFDTGEITHFKAHLIALLTYVPPERV